MIWVIGFLIILALALVGTKVRIEHPPKKLSPLQFDLAKHLPADPTLDEITQWAKEQYPDPDEQIELLQSQIKRLETKTNNSSFITTNEKRVLADRTEGLKRVIDLQTETINALRNEIRALRTEPLTEAKTTGYMKSEYEYMPKPKVISAAPTPDGLLEIKYEDGSKDYEYLPIGSTIWS